MRKSIRLAAPALLVSAALMLTACNEGDEAAPAPDATPSEQASEEQGGDGGGSGKQPIVKEAYATKPDGTGSVLAIADNEDVLYVYGGKEESQFTETDGPADGDLCTGKRTEGKYYPKAELQCTRGSTVFTEAEIMDGYKSNEVRVSWKNSEIEVLRRAEVFVGCELQEVADNFGKPCESKSNAKS